MILENPSLSGYTKYKNHMTLFGAIISIITVQTHARLFARISIWHQNKGSAR